MTTRIKSTTPLIATRDQAERLLGEIAKLTIARNEVGNTLDRTIQEAREVAEPQLTGINQQIKEKTELLRGWAETNPEEFGKRKSTILAHGVCGFRTGTPKLKLLTRRTWDTVLATLKAVRWGVEYIRTKEEVDKERILADLAQDSLTEEALSSVGVRMVQEESFFVEPKLEEIAQAA